MAEPGPPPLSAEDLFDKVGPAYEDAFANLKTQLDSVQWLLKQLADRPGSRIVDIGCGTGKPVCLLLAEHGHDVLGIDISGAMIDAARERVPGALFEKLDFRDFHPPPESFDAVTIYFSLIAGVTQNEIREFLSRAYGFLKPEGYLVWGTVPVDAENHELSWMGKHTKVSSLSPDGARDAVTAAGFEIVQYNESVFLPKAVEAGICTAEEVWEEPHLFICARKP